MAYQVIEARGLTRAFNGFTAVDSVDMKVGEGEIFGLLGPNGAGKTTTIRMLACLIRPSRGNAYVCGIDILSPAGAGRIRGMVGILNENPGFYDTLSAYKNLRFYADLYHMERHKANRSIEHYLSLFGLWSLRDAPIAGFSRGMRQKLALARCLIHEPRLLFMDEPTSGLDPESARTVRDSIRSIKKEGRTILLCTHNLDEAERLCDRIAIMNRRILEVGPPHMLKRSMDRKVIIRLERMSDRILSMLDGMDGVRNVEKEGDSLVLEVDNPESNNADIINSIVRVGGRIQFVSERGQSLEDVYLRLVGGRHVR